MNFRDIYLDKPINLDAPQLCYFEDMTSFIPWDGKNNLIVKYDSEIFSKIKKSSDKDDKTSAPGCNIM